MHALTHSEAAAHDVLRFQPVVDALTAHVALLDAEGTIIGVNSAWRRFSNANGNRQDDHGIGVNYLALLDGIHSCAGGSQKEAQDATLARKVAAGLRRVLNHSLSRFQIEYPCDSPDERRWFLLTIAPFIGGGRVCAIVSHEDLTALKLANEETLKRSEQLAASFSKTVDAIALAVEKRDAYTAGHQLQVSLICDALAGILGIDQNQRQGLLLGAKIHDIGKIAVPTEILGKPARLSKPELEIIRAHPDTGYDILKGIDFPWPIADMVHQHHERLDGSGYPRGLSGDEICLEARIIAVADVFDAITTHRPYRSARSIQDGIDELVTGRGKWYDPSVVDAMLHYLER